MMNRIIQLVFPPRCIFCGKILESGTSIEICNTCYTHIPFLPGRMATWRMKDETTYYDDLICVCEYTGLIKKALVKYKFHEKAGYYRAFAGLLSRRVINMAKLQNFDIIISVPLHKNRKKQRGYDQALLIGRVVSRKTAIPLRKDILFRILETRSQSILDAKERKRNIHGAFQVKNADIITSKSILLVDDVFTTGSTVNECARTLKEAGAKKVTVAVIASGRKF